MTELGMVMDVRLQHPQKHDGGMLVIVIELGMSTTVRLKHSQKAWLPMLVTDSGMVTEVTELPKKALSSIPTTEYVVPLTVIVGGMTIGPE